MTGLLRVPRPIRVLLGAATLLVGGFVLSALIAGLQPVAPGPNAGASPSPSPTSAMAKSPIGIDMAGNADCAACHLTDAGTVGVKPIPVLAHPLEGWRECTACHANDRLVKTAPGHSGLHKADCLVCHKAPAPGASAAPRPHHVYEGKACVSCHGKEAPLPTDMAGRTNCWLCHGGREFQDLFAPSSSAEPSPSPSG